MFNQYVLKHLVRTGAINLLHSLPLIPVILQPLLMPVLWRGQLRVSGAQSSDRYLQILYFVLSNTRTSLLSWCPYVHLHSTHYAIFHSQRKPNLRIDKLPQTCSEFNRLSNSVMLPVLFGIRWMLQLHPFTLACTIFLPWFICSFPSPVISDFSSNVC